MQPSEATPSLLENEEYEHPRWTRWEHPWFEPCYIQNSEPFESMYVQRVQDSTSAMHQYVDDLTRADGAVLAAIGSVPPADDSNRE